jgi:hypothetical protein
LQEEPLHPELDSPANTSMLAKEKADKLAFFCEFILTFIAIAPAIDSMAIPPKIYILKLFIFNLILNFTINLFSDSFFMFTIMFLLWVFQAYSVNIFSHLPSTGYRLCQRRNVAKANLSKFVFPQLPNGRRVKGWTLK